MIKVILFDFFDVFRADAYKAWLANNGITHDGEYAQAAHDQDIGLISNEEFFERLSALQGRPVTREEMIANAWVDHEMIRLAEQLHKRYKTALISNAPSQVIRELLHEHNLERLFDEIIISSEVNLVKPNPEIFHLALNKLTAKPNEAVFIDDNPKHVAAAEHIGIAGVQFVSARQLNASLAKIGVIVN